MLQSCKCFKLFTVDKNLKQKYCRPIWNFSKNSLLIYSTCTAQCTCILYVFRSIYYFLNSLQTHPNFLLGNEVLFKSAVLIAKSQVNAQNTHAFCKLTFLETYELFWTTNSNVNGAYLIFRILIQKSKISKKVDSSVLKWIYYRYKPSNILTSKISIKIIKIRTT